tara:strand:+ start:1194 stop:1709 length:516 start_codon:yes stop_codon:yes gene_type:complete
MPDKSPEELIREKKIKAGGGGRMTTTRDDNDRAAFLAQIRGMPEYKAANAPGEPQPEVGATTLGAERLREHLDNIRLKGEWRGHGGVRTALVELGSLGLSPATVKGDEQKQLASALGWTERQEFEEREVESRKRKIHRTRRDFGSALQDAFKDVDGVEVEASPGVLEEYKK